MPAGVRPLGNAGVPSLVAMIREPSADAAMDVQSPFVAVAFVHVCEKELNTTKLPNAIGKKILVARIFF